MREWIMDDRQEEPTFLIRRDFDGQLRGWQRADVSGVVDALGDVAYAAAIGEEEDTLTFFVLTDVTPVPVKVTQTLCPGIGFTDVELSWRKPGVRGKAGNVSVRGFRQNVEV